MYRNMQPDLKIKTFFHDLNSICSELTIESDISNVLSKLMEMLADFLDTDQGSFYLVLDRKITSISSVGENPRIEIEISSEDEKRLVATNFALEEEDLAFYPSLSILTSKALGIKLLSAINYSNNLFGFITLGPKYNKAPYNESDKLILALITNFVARIIFYSNHYIEASGKTSDELYLRNITDTISGVYIKTYVEQRMTEGIKEAIRYKKPYSLTLLSIDKFEDLRKKYGQHAVNALLQEVGIILTNLLRRDVDHAGKYSEDTFIVLLPSTERKGAIIFSERLKTRLSRLAIEKHPNVTITTSLGVTSLEPNDKKKEEVVNKLIEALHHSVKNGGDILSFNYDGLISENLSDFEKATGMSAQLLKNAVENPFYLLDENGNEIDFTKPTGTKNWINIPKQH